MRRLSLFAIAIDDVRDMFGASPELAEQLRTSAASHFPPPAKPRRVGLFRREPALQVDPNNPNRADVDALLAGGYVSPDRLVPSWRLLLAWLEDRAAHHGTVQIDAMDRWEFDLARAGLPSDYSLRHLAGRDLSLPLRPLPHQTTGYAKHVQAVETEHALEKVAADADEEFAGLLADLEPVREVLRAVATDERLDLVVVQIDALT